MPKGKARNAVLILFSLIFYAWGEPIWVFLLILTAFSDYIHAKSIEKHLGTARAKFSLILSVLTDIGIFIVFKYSGFIISNINALTGLSLYVPQFRLPIGISFYTFQTLTYVIDVYRGKQTSQKSFFKYLLYLSMYFQLVAGPIVRYGDVAESIEQRNETLNKFSHGIYRFTLGLSKKVIIANAAGVFADKYMNADVGTLSCAAAWFGIIMYTVQLYFDFSGYSDMAIGLGHMFSFKFPENFNYPYISKSVSEFWRRWHITLGSFFRDYVYIPLGGNRSHVYRNLFIVWFLTGFWHGASWNFIIWGLYNGLFIMLERLTKPVFEKIPSFFRHIYLLIIVNVGFVFFRFSSFYGAADYLKVMFSGTSTLYDMQTGIEILNNIFWIAAAFLFCTPVIKYIEKLYRKMCVSGTVLSLFAGISRLVLIFTLLFVCTCHLAGNSFNPFLYFQF